MCAGPQPVPGARLQQRREEQEQDQAGDGGEAGALGERGGYTYHHMSVPGTGFDSHQPTKTTNVVLLNYFILLILIILYSESTPNF